MGGMLYAIKTIGQAMVVAFFIVVCIIFLVYTFIVPSHNQRETNRAVGSLVNNNFEAITLPKENVVINEITKELFYIKRNITEEGCISSNVNNANIEKWNISLKAKKPMKELFSIPDECKGKKIVFETFQFTLFKTGIFEEDQVKYAIGASCS